MPNICEICGKDISNRRGRARYCVECAVKVREERYNKKLKKRYCEVCGKPLENKLARKYCPSCAKKVKYAVGPTVRHCALCGQVITGRRYNAKYCTECAKLAKRAAYNSQKATRLLKLSKEPQYGDITQCKTCTYWDKNDKWCDFLTKTGRPRRCEPSPNCTEYEKGKRVNYESSKNDDK